MMGKGGGEYYLGDADASTRTALFGSQTFSETQKAAVGNRIPSTSSRVTRPCPSVAN